MKTWTKTVRCGGAGARGFTLLEMVLTSAALASMSLLLGALWAQAGSIESRAIELDTSLRPARVEALLRDQWSERRVLTPASNGFRLEANALEFVTARPLLEPNWPLVRARYEIRAHETSSGPGRLVYLESRITDVVSGQSGSTEKASEIVLLEADLAPRLEWLGPGPDGSLPWLTPDDSTQPTRVRSIRLQFSVQGETLSCILAVEASPSRSF